MGGFLKNTSIIDRLGVVGFCGGFGVAVPRNGVVREIFGSKLKRCRLDLSETLLHFPLPRGKWTGRRKIFKMAPQLLIQYPVNT